MTPRTRVVQVYWRPDGEPVRLIGWSVVDAEPGQTTSVEVPVEARVLRDGTTVDGSRCRSPARC